MEVNMLELIPVKLVKHIEKENGQISLLIPKFANTFLRNFLIPARKSKDIHINLDQIGSQVWKKIDNKKNILQLSEELQEELGEKIQPAHERISLFIQNLLQNKFIKLCKQTTEN